MSSPKTAVTLNPVPGFCVKSKALQQTDSSAPTQISISKGIKIFLNIAWDANVPPPPPGSEDAIHKAMLGDDPDESNPDGWFVPVVVSDGRPDTDKAGQPSVVFDCIFNSSIKSRTLKDPEFKTFIIELALQRVEARTSITLSRQIGTPNIASKGKPETRQVLVPTVLYPQGHPKHRDTTSLIQEIPPGSTTATAKPEVADAPKGVLKKATVSSSTPQTPSWSWTKIQSKIRIVIDVPGLTHAAIPISTLDIEPRRVILHIPALYELDITLDASDAELVATFAKCGAGDAALSLKRMRDLEVDTAKAEWRVADKTIIIIA
ncbi:hypothetical protein BV22DRAFT_1066784 [Leucogyrophana mollusca]|uniref:Uncharacterized protein n=1 Tax=Leucogyrophana mollusca TaxID=85980 RepID=A0ACB8BFI8_9AGAM|nr:hypothetical protein BV22DRAFT_1066784 [Leucogyrophana mollusca]